MYLPKYIIPSVIGISSAVLVDYILGQPIYSSIVCGVLVALFYKDRKLKEFIWAFIAGIIWMTLSMVIASSLGYNIIGGVALLSQLIGFEIEILLIILYGVTAFSSGLSALLVVTILEFMGKR